MKVLLMQDVKNVGKRGEIKEVSDGYGANYLIPRGYARILDKAAIADYHKMLRTEAEEEARKVAEAKETAAKLEKITLVFKAKAGKSGAMVGTVSTKSIEEKLRREYSIMIDKRKFIDHFTINAFGKTVLRIELYKGVVGKVTVQVNPEENR